MPTISPLPTSPLSPKTDAASASEVLAHHRSVALDGEPSPVPRAANRRRDRRFTPLVGIKASLLPGCLGLGKKTRVTLVNLSAAGGAVQTREEFRLGQEVTLILDAMFLARPLELPATVSRLRVEEGVYDLGLSLRKPLAYAELSRVTRT